MRSGLCVVITLGLMLTCPALAADRAPERLISTSQAVTCISESSIRQYTALRVAGHGSVEAINKMNAGKSSPLCVKRMSRHQLVNV